MSALEPLKKTLEFTKNEVKDYESRGMESVVYYLKGMIAGLEMAIAHIESKGGQ